MRNFEGRYANASIALHWLVLALVVLVYASIELREVFPKGSDPREALKTLHYSLGLCVLVLAAVRLAVRAWTGPPPPIVPPPGRWESIAAAVVQVALYGLMIGLPLLGWAMLGAAGDTTTLFGLALPPLMGPDEARGEVLEEWHEFAGTLGYGLIALHAGAALFHHYVRHDNTLVRMLAPPR